MPASRTSTSADSVVAAPTTTSSSPFSVRTAATASIAGAMNVASESTASRRPDRRCSGSGFGSVSSTIEGCNAAVPRQIAESTNSRSTVSPVRYQPCSEPNP